MRRSTIGFAVMLMLLVAMPAHGDTPEERAVRISKNVMSPFCPGATLHDCPSNAAIELREEIAAWAADGMTDGQIYDRLESEFGPGIRAVPGDGRSVLVWVIPGIALAAGLALAYVVARRWSRDSTRPKSIGGVESPTADDRRRIETELAGFRERLWGRR